MANGIPTLSLDHCGMSGVICEECGIKIPIHSYEQVTSAIATQIESCIMNPSRIETLSNGVLKCAGKFMWSNRVESFNQIYEQICQKAWYPFHPGITPLIFSRPLPSFLLRIHISDRYIRIFRHPWQLWASMETHYFLCIRLSAYRQHPQKRQRMELV